MRIDTATHLVSAEPEAVYRAFVDAGALMDWLPPAGMSGRVLLFEPWEGGRYRIELALEGEGHAGSGKTTERTDVTSGRFLALEPGRRIVQTVEFDSADPAFAGTMVMTWSLEPAPEGTRVTVAARDVPSGISAEDHQAGLASSLDNLARFAASPPDRRAGAGHPPAAAADYRFRPVVEADLPLLREWRGRPHWVEWWGPAEEDRGFFEEAMADPHTSAWIVEMDGRPFAYAQDYDPHAWPGHHFAHLPAGARGVDQSIGDSELIGRGHGSAFVRAHVDRLFAAGAPAVGTDPHPDNKLAIRAYEKAGFEVRSGPLETPWGRCLLMEQWRRTNA